MVSEVNWRVAGKTSDMYESTNPHSEALSDIESNYQSLEIVEKLVILVTQQELKLYIRQCNKKDQEWML